jgi:hypothetical protein
VIPLRWKEVSLAGRVRRDDQAKSMTSREEGKATAVAGASVEAAGIARRPRRVRDREKGGGGRNDCADMWGQLVRVVLSFPSVRAAASQRKLRNSPAWPLFTEAGFDCFSEFRFSRAIVPLHLRYKSNPRCEFFSIWLLLVHVGSKRAS